MKGERSLAEQEPQEMQEKAANDNGTVEKRESGEKSDVLSLNEFIKEAGETMNSVVNALEKERGYAAEVRKMGARVTRETAQKIMDLEKQRNRLEEEVDNAADFLVFTVSAGADPSSAARLRTKELDALLNDPEAYEITDDMVTEVQSDMELKVLEASLQDEADNAQFEMADIITQLHALKKEKKPEAPAWNPELRQGLRNILSSRTKELETRIEELSKPERPENEMDDVDRYYAGQRAEELKRSRAELEQVFSQGLEMDTAIIEENAGPAETDRMDGMLAGVLDARFNELQNYTRVLKSKLKDVRTDLGLVRGVDGNKDMKKAA